MRNRKLKLTEETFKNYLINLYVDEFGEKVSCRKVWSTSDFFSYTGMFKINKYTGEKERCSEGTISHYNKKLNLSEEELFEYHQQITKRISLSVEFKDWSRKNNKGYSKEEVLNQETLKRRMIKFFGLNETYQNFSPNKVKQLAERIFGKSELEKFYKEVKNGKSK